MTMKLKDKMQGLDLMTARPKKSAGDHSAVATGDASGNVGSGANLMSNIISQTGQDLKTRVKALESEIRQYRDKEQAGKMVIEISIDAIDRPDLVMRSEHYWTTDRYQEIKESIRKNGLKEPITVRIIPGSDRYMLVKGDTRLRAYTDLLGEDNNKVRWGKIEARVESMGDEMAVVTMIIENRDRENIYAYDQAVFYTRVYKEVFGEDRQLTLEMLDISDGWLSRNISISAIPMSVMDSFPSLYQAGAKTLYPLSTAIANNADKLSELMKNADTMRATSVTQQADKLIRFLEGKLRRRRSAQEKREVTGQDGKVLAEVKRGSRYDSLKIDKQAMPGFAEMLEEKIKELYAEWRERNGHS